MKNKKYILSLIVLGISLVIGIFFANTANSKNKIKAQEPIEAHAITDNIFQSVKIVTKKNSQTIGFEESLENDTEVTVTMKFKFMNKNYKAGDTFVTKIPKAFSYNQELTGDLKGGAKFKIDPATDEVTITLLEDVQAAEYTIDLTTMIHFDKDQASTQTLLFNTQTPTKYTLRLYQARSQYVVYGKLFDKEGTLLNPEGKMALMPAKGGQFEGIDFNHQHIDLSKNSLLLTYNTKLMPSYWTDGYVNINQNFDAFKYYTYDDTTIDGKPIGEKKELIKDVDFSLVPVAEQTTEKAGALRVEFKNAFHGTFEIAEGETTFDYSEFNPISNGRDGRISFLGINGNIYPGKAYNTNPIGSLTRLNYEFYVRQVGYLGFGEIKKDSEVKTNERIEKTPIYINSTNQELKKGDKFTLTNEGTPGLVLINTNLAREYQLESDQYGRVTVKGSSKQAITNWKITNDELGTIVLEYTGEDTNDAVGLDIYVGIDDSVVPHSQPTFILTGNGYRTTGVPIVDGRTNNYKSGVYSIEKNYITWEATINSLYKKVTKLTDTFGYGMKKDSLANLKITSVEFGKNGKQKTLVEHEDYEIIDSSDSFEIKFLKEINEKLTLNYTTKVDMETVDKKNYRAKNTITPTIEFEGSVVKEFPTDGYASIPNSLITNAPVLFSRNSSSSVTQLIEGQPVNQVKLLINPAGMELENNKVTLDFKHLGVSVLDGEFKVNKVKTFSLSTYQSLVLGDEIASSSKEYPKVTIEEDQMTITNKTVTEPIVVSFTFAKNNYYDIVNDTIGIKQTTDNLLAVDQVSSALYFKNYLDSSFDMKASETYSNVGEATFAIKKNHGSAIIKGTQINLMSGISDGTEISSLREVTDEDGNPLPANVVSLSKSYSNYTLIVNDAELTNGLIVKMSLRFNTSGKKSYTGGAASYKSVNANGTYISQSYLDSYYKWRGEFLIDNAGASGDAELITKDLVLKTVDSATNEPLAGVTFEILNQKGEVKETQTTNANGEIVLKEYVVTTYQIREVSYPEGYTSNEEYKAPGKSYTMSSDSDNTLIIPYTRAGQLKVHFSYDDRTELETIEPIIVNGVAGKNIDLKAQSAIADQLQQLASETDYRYLSFDAGGLEGIETSLKFPSGDADVYFKYEGLLSLQVPKLLTFETGFVSPFTQTLSYENQDDFEVSLRDSRQITSSALTKESKTRGNIRLNAALSKEFKTAQNKVLRDARLFYHTGENSVLLNGAGGELVNNKQDKTNPGKKDFTFILDTTQDKNEGFKLEVPAKGTLAEEYTGEVTWEIIQEP